MFRKFSVISLGILVSACTQYGTKQNVQYDYRYNMNSHVTSEAEQFAQMLRAHFLGKDIGTDLSTLISQARAISTRLKRAGKLKLANQFDSYIDVLMYGNNTLDESINDVLKLVNNGYIPNEEHANKSSSWF